METNYTLTYSELVEVFKRWDTEHLNEYPDAQLTDPNKDSKGQANEFVRQLNIIQSEK